MKNWVSAFASVSLVAMLSFALLISTTPRTAEAALAAGTVGTATISIDTNGVTGNGTYTTLGTTTGTVAPILLEGADGDFAVNAATTWTITAPTGFQFNPVATLTTISVGADVVSSSAAQTSTTLITVTMNIGGVANRNSITVNGIQVRPIDATTTIGAANGAMAALAGGAITGAPQTILTLTAKVGVVAANAPVTGGVLGTTNNQIWSSTTVPTTGVLAANLVITEPLGVTWVAGDTIRLLHPGYTLAGGVVNMSVQGTVAATYFSGYTILHITTTNAIANDQTITISAVNVGASAASADNTVIAAVAAGGLNVPISSQTTKRLMLAWNTSTTASTTAINTVVPITGADNNSIGGALCAYQADAAGAAAVGVPITYTVNLGVVSTGTAKTALAVTGTAGSVCTNYRGGGGIATSDTAIASNSLLNQVATLPITLTAPSGSTASKMVISQPNNSAVSASQTTTSPGYVSPTQQTNFGIQVQDSAGLGVGGQVVLITTDKGALVAGFNGTGCAGASSKAVTSTSALAAAPQALTVGGTAVTGGISVTYCGNQNDASGSATITVSNISTSMANQTTTIKTGGRPAKVEATYAAGVISATVNDANGNTVADGTPVQFTISANAGAVSNTCTTTSNGKATSAVSLNTGSGSVIVTAGYNETGAAAGGCSVVAAVAAGGNAGAVPVIGTTLGSAQSVSTVVNIGTVVTPPATVAPVAAPASGAGAFAAAPVYSAGKQASAVFNGGTLVQFQAAITAAGGTGAWAQDSKGNFVAHIVGGGPVNAAFAAAFPTGFAGVTAVTVIGK